MATIKEAWDKKAEARQDYGIAMAFAPADVVERAAKRLDEADRAYGLAVLDAARDCVIPLPFSFGDDEQWDDEVLRAEIEGGR